MRHTVPTTLKDSHDDDDDDDARSSSFFNTFLLSFLTLYLLLRSPLYAPFLFTSFVPLFALSGAARFRSRVVTYHKVSYFLNFFSDYKIFKPTIHPFYYH